MLNRDGSKQQAMQQSAPVRQLTLNVDKMTHTRSTPV